MDRREFIFAIADQHTIRSNQLAMAITDCGSSLARRVNDE